MLEPLCLFSDWHSCSFCGVRKDNCVSPATQLLICSRCKSVAYCTVDCQRAHWKATHKIDCKEWHKALTPLLELIQWQQYEYTSWLSRELVEYLLQRSNDDCWQLGVKEWYDEKYWMAMDTFQRYLEPFQKAWATCSNQQSLEFLNFKNDEGFQICERLIDLAKRLLFCAYCELDANRVNIARQRLVQCLSIVITLLPMCDSINRVQEIMSDAWMELTLSMEEVKSHRILARHVAKMAICTRSCDWVNPLQRPGYMVTPSITSIPYVPPEMHPPWCKVFEDRWQQILKEYYMLTERDPHKWFDVGSGQRGSGYDDHHVLSGKSWKEYILFGTGASGDENDMDAPVTKQLIRNHLPDAISLANLGGGEVVFSRLAPGSHIEAHCGPTNLRWTAHLGLIIPTSASSCRIRVGNDWYSWEAGRILLFDDSFEHEVRNDSLEERVVLLIRLWHPQLSCTETTEIALQREDFLLEAMSRKKENIQKRYHPPD